MSTAGICPCGGHLKEASHTVKRHATATQWDETITPQQLPVRIERLVCTACGRDEVMRVRHNHTEETDE